MTFALSQKQEKVWIKGKLVETFNKYSYLGTINDNNEYIEENKLSWHSRYVYYAVDTSVYIRK